MLNNNSPVETAIELCEQGFYPVPVEYKGKNPYIPNGKRPKLRRRTPTSISMEKR